MTSLLWLSLLGCDTEPAPETAELLSPREQLIRLSVDLRGVHPSETELQAIEANPKLYSDYVDRYLEDDRFLERIREIFDQRFKMRTGSSWFSTSSLGLGGISDDTLNDALADEPLRLLSWIVQHDLSYAEMVSADYTIANEIVAAAWGLDYPEGASGWQPARYQDGRPHVGVLSMTSTWLRYPSMGGNANRHRANALSQLFLCDDYLSRPIVLDRAAVDQLTEDPESAISENPSCQSCHSTLDPLAAHFFGFFWEDEEGDSTLYRPENEQNWRDWANDPPAWYGVPTKGLGDLGQVVAEDDRFASCATQTVYEGLMQRSLQDEDWEEFQALKDQFIADGLVLRPLIRSLVLSDSYLLKTATSDEEDRQAGVRVVSPAQLSSVMADLTGFQWDFGGRDALVKHHLGIPGLAGGLDGSNAGARSYEPSLGIALVQERLAQAAAWHVVQHDLDPERSEDPILLAYVTLEDTPESSPEAYEAQVRELYLRVTGLPLDEEATEPARLAELWKQVHSIEGSPEQAWAALLTAVLRDPRILFY